MGRYYDESMKVFPYQGLTYKMNKMKNKKKSIGVTHLTQHTPNKPYSPIQLHQP
jgi:hypothetical protein